MIMMMDSNPPPPSQTAQLPSQPGNGPPVRNDTGMGGGGDDDSSDEPHPSMIAIDSDGHIPNDETYSANNSNKKKNNNNSGTTSSSSSSSSSLMMPTASPSNNNNNNNTNSNRNNTKQPQQVTATTESMIVDSKTGPTLTPPPPPSTLSSNNNNNCDSMTTRLAKILSCLQGAIGANVQDEAVAQQSQLLVAMAATMAAAATGNDETMAMQQEQLLASMAPTLVNMVNQNLNQTKRTGGVGNLATIAIASNKCGNDSQSAISSNDEDNCSKSKKRRKQSKPVRYESHTSTTNVQSFDDQQEGPNRTNRTKSAGNNNQSRLSSSMSQAHISSMHQVVGDNVILNKDNISGKDKLDRIGTREMKCLNAAGEQRSAAKVQLKQRQMQQQQQHGTNITSDSCEEEGEEEEEEEEDDGDDQEEDEEEDVVDGEDVDGDVEESNGGRCFEDFANDEERDSRGSRLIEEVEDGGPSPSDVAAAAASSSLSSTTAIDADNNNNNNQNESNQIESAADIMMTREKQILLQQFGMLASWQQKLLQQPTFTCPQCNSPFANEDQLRAHIDLEHMPKLSTSSFSNNNSNNPSTLVNKNSSGIGANNSHHHHHPQQGCSTVGFNVAQHQLRKRSKRKRSPSNRSNSSATSSNDGECSSIGDRKSPYQQLHSSNNNDLQTKCLSANNNGQQQQSSQSSSSSLFHSKDLNHNLLGLNLPPNLLNPLISSLTSSSSQSSNQNNDVTMQKPSQHRHSSQSSSPLLQQPVSTASPDPKISTSTTTAATTPTTTSSNEAASSSNRQSPTNTPNNNMIHNNNSNNVSLGQQPSSSFLTNSMAPFFFPHMFPGHNPSNSQFQSPSAMINGIPVPPNTGPRIFNPEAYCELCNKEFCNKYFLKTHKANKHNIYTADNNSGGGGSSSGGAAAAGNSGGNSGNSQSSGQGGNSGGNNVANQMNNSQMASPFANSAMLMNNNNSMSVAQSAAAAKHLLAMATSGSGNNNSGDPSSFLNGLTAAGQQQSGQPGPFQPPLRLNLNMNMINLDSYCEVCQKEFCNKYFLKKHKQKIHGFIYQGDTPIPPSQNSPQMQQLQQLQLLHQQLAAQHHHQAMNPTTSQSPSSLSNNNGNNNKNDSPTDTAGTTTISSDVNKLVANNNNNNNTNNSNASPSPSGLQTSSSSSNDKSMLMNTSQSSSVNANPSMATTGDNQNHQPPSSNTTTVSAHWPNFSNSQLILTPERLRQMGVINTEAFCEICCKEFCNKYFLRTHKFNKHRIVDSSSSNPKSNPLAQINQQLQQSQQQQQQQQQSSQPPQQHQQTPTSQPSDSLLAQQMAQSLAAHTQSSNQTFPGLFPNSMVTNASVNDDGQLEPGQRDPTSYGKNGSDFLNGFASATGNTGSGESVKCEICSQNFHNNHLLKMHKYYSHGISYVKLEQDLDVVTKKVSDSETTKNDDLSSVKVKNESTMEFGDSDAEPEINASTPQMLMANAESNNEQSSQDLQKLHTMITELDSLGHVMAGIDEDQLMMAQKDLNNSEHNKIYCHLCKFQCDSRYFLRAHLINEHGLPPSAEEAFAQISDHLAMKSFLEQQQQQQQKNLFGGGSSNSESNTTTSSEAFCDICNKEFCSKYFLKTHKQNIHGILDNSGNDTPPATSSSSGPSAASQQQQQLQRPPSQPQSLIPPSLLNSLYQCTKTPAELESLNLALSQAMGVLPPHTHQQSPKPSSPGQPESMNNSNNGNNNNNGSSTSGLNISNKFPSNSPNNLINNSGNNGNSSITATIKAAMMAGLVSGCGVVGGGGEHQKSRLGQIITGRNYCNICNKELCNKYFMKTHMFKMHGINIDEHPIEAASTSTIGGVTCDICQKELCSKYFLKVHKQNTHGIYEDGSAPILLGPSFPSPNSTAAAQQQSSSPVNKLMMNFMNNNCGQNDFNPLLLMSMANSGQNDNNSNSAASDTNSVGSSNSEKDHCHGQQQQSNMELQRQHEGHHNNDTVPSNNNIKNPVYQEICHICDRRFKSIKWLKAHMINDHGELLAIMHRNDLQNSFAVMDPNGRLCFICGQTFHDRIQMQIHLMKEHKTTPEEVAMNLANFKMQAMMAAAAAASSSPMETTNNPINAITEMPNMEQESAKPPQPAKSTSPPSSIPSSSPPPCPVSPKDNTTIEDDNRNGLPSNKTANSNDPYALLQNPALQNLLLKNPQILAALAGAVSDQNDPMLSQQLLSSLFGTTTIDGEKPPPPPPTTMTTSSSRSESPLEFNKDSNMINVGGSSKKYSCHFCNKTYRHSHSLQRHMMTHSKLPPFKAAQMNEPPTATAVSSSKPPTPSNISSAADVNAHQRQKMAAETTVLSSSVVGAGLTGQGGGANNNKSKNKRYRCSKCNTKFRTRELCQVHIRAKHISQIKSNLEHQHETSANKSSTALSPAMVRCTTCNSYFANTIQLKLHISQNHCKPLSTSQQQQQQQQHPSSLVVGFSDSSDLVPLNLRTGTGSCGSDQHTLPPSPSASGSEDDDYGVGVGEFGVAARRSEPKNNAANKSREHSQNTLVQDVIMDDPEEEDDETEDDEVDDDDDGGHADHTTASNIQSTSSPRSNNPSLICVNGSE